ncbi:FabD/lysophospholipase-like protein [Cenococcum geophilum]
MIPALIRSSNAAFARTLRPPSAIVANATIRSAMIVGRPESDDKSHKKASLQLGLTVRYILNPAKWSENEKKCRAEDEANSFWFGVRKDKVDYFLDEGRVYDELLPITSSPRTVMSGVYPGLISFVGETGAGKSTLINFLVDLLDPEGPKREPKPVVSDAKDREGEFLPTSSGIHLFSDPVSNESNQPLLYVDCEGLTGGQRAPITSSYERIQKSSPRKIAWNEVPDDREFWSAKFYPRILYAFSDVVVFVIHHSNAKKIEEVAKRLIVWAFEVLEKAINQPVLPSAVIAINQVPLDSHPDLWRVGPRTQQVMDQLEKASLTREFDVYDKFWIDRGFRFENLKSLLDSQYAGIKVVSIPEKGDPVQLSEQIKALGEEITKACSDTQSKKRHLGTRRDASKLELFLGRAFDHFVKSSDKPFDFVQAFFEINPIVDDDRFTTGIFRLAAAVRNMHRELQCSKVWCKIGDFVLSCIILWASRSERPEGSWRQDAVFNRYCEEFCDKAIKQYCRAYLPCSFKFPVSQLPCVNLVSGHAVGHQNELGLINRGDFNRRYEPEQLQEEFREKLKESWKQIQNADESQIHKDARRRFFTEMGNLEAFKTRLTCFSCLSEHPEHPLPCGHVLCTLCIRSAGERHGKCFSLLSQCPLCPPSPPKQDNSRYPWLISFKPPEAGVRIMTLDGGGIRGIVELVILRKLQEELGAELPIQTFFDLIVGTSAGGIIALALGVQGKTVEECSREFAELWKEGVIARYGAEDPFLRYWVIANHHSKYRTSPLKNAFEKAFGSIPLFSAKSQSQGPLPKVAVTTTTVNGEVHLLSDYNRQPGGESSYTFSAVEIGEGSIKVREAARATAAAPVLFEPMFHKGSGQVYLDGAIYHNNPINIASEEKTLIWGHKLCTHPDLCKHPGHQLRKHPDIVLSIGSGYPPRHGNMTPSSPVESGVRSFIRTYRAVGDSHVKNILSSDRIWNTWLASREVPSHHSKRYRRLNIKLNPDPAGPDESEMLRRLAESSLDQEVGPEVKEIARQLIASSFFFYHTWKTKDKSAYFDGIIECRFPPDKETTRFLGGLHTMLSQKNIEKLVFHHTIVTHGDCVNEPLELTISLQDIENMKKNGSFLVNWEIPDIFWQHKKNRSRPVMLPKSEISVCLHRDEFLPISGFPRRLSRTLPDTAT